MKLSKILFVTICLSSTWCISAQIDIQHKKDSLLRIATTTTDSAKTDAYWQLTDFLFDHEMRPDTIMKYYEAFEAEAIRQKDVKAQEKIKANTILALYNRKEYADVINRAPAVLEFLQEQESWKLYCVVYNNIIMAYFLDGQREKAIEEATLFYRQAQKIGSPYASISAMNALGRLYFNLHYYKEAAEYLEKAIDEAKKHNDNNEILSLRLSIYPSLSDIYVYLEEYEKAGALFEEWEKSLIGKEKQSGERNTAELINFYSYNMNRWNRQLNAEKAEYYCNLLEDLGVDSQAAKLNILNGRWHIAYIRGDYANALIYADEILKIVEEGNDLNKIYSALINKANTLCYANKPEDCLRTFDRALRMKDSIRSLGIAAQPDELRTQYDISRYIADKERNRNYFLFALAGCVLLVVTLGIWIYYNRKVVRKNKALVLQIKELQAQQKARDNETPNKATFPPVEDTNDDGFCPEKRKDQLCAAIRDMILKEKAYRDPTINRKVLISRLGTNKDLFIEAFQYCFKMSFPEFINSLRLKDAINLLEQSDLSVEAISDKVGFGTVRTFQRQFQAKYNMSPKDYRKLAQE